MMDVSQKPNHTDFGSRLHAGACRFAIIVTVVIIGVRIWRHKHDKDLGQW